MPRLSDSMEEGTIIKWLKAEGDEVARGDELVEIETDKATMTYEADSDGVLQIVAAEGDTLPVGEVIARLNGRRVTGRPASGVGRRALSPRPRLRRRPSRSPSPSPSRSRARAEGNGGERVKASPIARRMASEKGLDLVLAVRHRTRRPHRQGRRRAAPRPRRPTPDARRRTPTPGARPARASPSSSSSRAPNSSSPAAWPSPRPPCPTSRWTWTSTWTAAVAMRAQLKDVAEVVPSFNDMVVKACALALREYPRANGSYKDGRYELHARVNVGVAVAAQDALIVPTVFDADRKSLGEIARATRELAGKVREGTIAPPELSGGTFTVSNLGMYGITSFTAVINPPQAAILAVGAIEQRPVVVDGEIVPRHRMAVTLACDHRILYGADAAEFLARIRDLLAGAGLARALDR